MTIEGTVTISSNDDERDRLKELLHEFLRERLARRELDPMTARNYRSALNVFVTIVDRLPFDADDIGRWREERSHLKPATARSHFSMIRAFSRWLYRKGYLPDDPTREVSAPKLTRRVPRALPVPAVARLLAVAPDARARAIVWLMVGLGLRCVEVARLELGDWDRTNAVVIVRGKFDHERILPMTAEVVAAVDEYLLEYPASGGPLIRSYPRPGHALQADTLSGMVSEWMNAADVKRMPRDGVSAHALRHTAASDVLDACGDLRVVQEMLGHRNLSTTSIYLRRAGMGAMREAMEGRSYAETDPAA